MLTFNFITYNNLKKLRNFMQVRNYRLRNTRYKKHKRKIHQRFRQNVFERDIKEIIYNTAISFL